MIVTSGVIAYLTAEGVMTIARSINVQISCVDGKQFSLSGKMTRAFRRNVEGVPSWPLQVKSDRTWRDAGEIDRHRRKSGSSFAGKRLLDSLHDPHPVGDSKRPEPLSSINPCAGLARLVLEALKRHGLRLRKCQKPPLQFNAGPEDPRFNELRSNIQGLRQLPARPPFSFLQNECLLKRRV